MTPAALDQAITIQHGMDGAFGGDLGTGESPSQALADFVRPPVGMLALDVEDVVLHLKGKLMRIPIRTSAPIGQQPAPRIPGNDSKILYVVLWEIPNSLHSSAIGSPASRRPTLKPFVHHRTLLPWHSTPPRKRRERVTSLGYDLSPMCRIAHNPFWSSRAYGTGD